jgi:hypothetical protein
VNYPPNRLTTTERKSSSSITVSLDAEYRFVCSLISVSITLSLDLFCLLHWDQDNTRHNKVKMIDLILALFVWCSVFAPLTFARLTSRNSTNKSQGNFDKVFLSSELQSGLNIERAGKKNSLGLFDKMLHLPEQHGSVDGSKRALFPVESHASDPWACSTNTILYSIPIDPTSLSNYTDSNGNAVTAHNFMVHVRSLPVALRTPLHHLISHSY